MFKRQFKNMWRTNAPRRIFKKIIIAILIILLVWGFGSLLVNEKIEAPQIPVATVFMTKDGFVPTEIAIKLGQSIEFINSSPTGCLAGDAECNVWPVSDPYPSHDLYPEFNPEKPIQPGTSWVFTFNKAGNWGFHDHLRYKNRGVVRVMGK